MTLVALGQLCSTADIAHNLAQCQLLVHQAADAGAKALFLPEASDYIASSAAETISLAQPIHTSPFVIGLQHSAAKNNLCINVGVHEPTEPVIEGGSEGKKVKNTSIWINAQGQITAKYSKLHLFDVDLSDSGGPVLKESNSVQAGNSVTPPFRTAIGNLGLMICFDLRFPLLSSRLRALGAAVLTYPSAFTVPTGEAHWEVLLRARAVENQCFVVAAAQVGWHHERRVSYGHGVIVDPWGRVLAEGKGVEGWEESGREVELVVADLDSGVLERVRREMPLQARTDVLDLIEK